ncbi:MAG: VOC family protein [Steroidobacteraceae bacterium]
MKIEHVAFWTENIEQLAEFYAAYFGATVGPKYVNPAKRYESRFICFEGGARVELMSSLALDLVKCERGAQRMGLAHLAFAVGSAQRVDELTDRLKRDGYAVVDGPRHTGDGYYESVVLDPDGNRLEVTV